MTPSLFLESSRPQFTSGMRTATVSLATPALSSKWICDFLKYVENLVISRNGLVKQLFHELAEIISYFMN